MTRSWNREYQASHSRFAKDGLCADLVKLCCNVVLLFWKLSLYCVAGLCCNLSCCSLALHVKCLLVCPTCFNKIHVDVMNVICFNLKNYDIEFLLMWWINHEFIYLFIYFWQTNMFCSMCKDFVVVLDEDMNISLMIATRTLLCFVANILPLLIFWIART